MGIETRRYGDYVTRSWRHFVPHKKRFEHIDRVSHIIKDYDIVAIQEADAGSLRSGFINIVEYLARASKFPYWYSQCNRNLGRIAQHSNGFLSRFEVSFVHYHRLPGFIPGRGAMQVFLGNEDLPLVLFVVHLALGERGRKRQLAYLAQLCQGYENVVIMGDMNCSAEQVLYLMEQEGVELDAYAEKGLATFPSWAPKLHLDHILVSPTLKIKSIALYEEEASDHLPMAMEIEVSEALYQSIKTPKPQVRRGARV